METDASTDGIGVVLSHVQEVGCSHPVAYDSRSLSPAERRITDLETMGHFHSYVYGSSVMSTLFRRPLILLSSMPEAQVSRNSR